MDSTIPAGLHVMFILYAEIYFPTYGRFKFVELMADTEPLSNSLKRFEFVPTRSAGALMKMLRRTYSGPILIPMSYSVSVDLETSMRMYAPVLFKTQALL